MNTLIANIAELVAVPRGPIPGRRMRQLPVIRDAAVLLEAGRIAWFGPRSALAAPPDCQMIDAGGGCVLPGLVDCHTHTVFAGTREHEFVQRLEGRSYAEIAEAGGGIRVTVDAVRRATLDELVELALPRLKRMAAGGVTTVEIKSGYGLTAEDELKMLRAVAELRRRQPLDLVGTYLAAHTTPREFAGRADAYLDVVLDDSLLSQIRREGLAEFADVFCERTAFTVEQSRRVLAACARHGLRGRLHADQITQMGASRLAAEAGAVSADHLEHIDEGGIAALKAAGTVAVLLPACSTFLGVAQAPARRMIEADLAVAVATDFNPGSSMIESLPLAMHLACTQMRMTPTEVVAAATANAAAAILRHDGCGAIDIGMAADLVILDVPNHARWLYEGGRNCVRAVLKAGAVIH